MVVGGVCAGQKVEGTARLPKAIYRDQLHNRRAVYARGLKASTKTPRQINFFFAFCAHGQENAAPEPQTQFDQT